MIRILKMIRSGPQTPNSLAIELNVCRRTVFRDLFVLRQEGLIKGYDDVNREYLLDYDFFLHSIHLTFSEALAVHKLCQEASEHDRDFSFCSAARTAGLKIAQTLPPLTRTHLNAMENLLKYHNVPKHRLGNKSFFFDSILDALRQRNCISVSYKSPVESQSFETVLSIYYVFFSRRTWYLIAYSSLHHEVRTFHIGRIVEMEILPETYEIPKQFSYDRYFRNAWHMIPEQEPDSEVILRFSPKVAQNVNEVLWHKTQKTLYNREGGLDFTVTVTGLNEILWWILGYGADVEVLMPERLKEMHKNTVRRMAQKHGLIPHDTF